MIWQATVINNGGLPNFETKKITYVILKYKKY